MSQIFGRRRRGALQLFGFHQIPIDSDDALVVEALERFWKNEITRGLAFLESRHSEIGPALAFLHGHDAIVFDHRLKMSILRGFLPEGVDLGFARFFHDIGKAHRFDFKQFHEAVEWLSG